MIAEIVVSAGCGVLAGAAAAACRARLDRRRADRKAAEAVAAARAGTEGLVARAAKEGEEAAAALRGPWERERASWAERVAEEERRAESRDAEIRSVEGLLATRDAQHREAQGDLSRAEDRVRRLRAELAGAREGIVKGLLAQAGWDRPQAITEYKTQLEKEVQLEEELRWRNRLSSLESQAEKEAQRLIEIVIQRMRPTYHEDHPHYTFAAEDLGKVKDMLEPGSPLYDAFERAAEVKLEWRKEEGALTLSCPNGLRREVARRVLKKLISQREPDVATLPKLRADADRETGAEMQKTIQWLLAKLRIAKIHPEMVRMMGRLKYRTSHAQNVLMHSYEVGVMGSMMSSELGLDAKLGKRGAFLHDVGKAIDAEKDAGHALVGGDFAQAHGESETVVNAIAGHHEDVERKSLYPVVAQVADAISGGRPGARRETTERFLERVDQLMAIGASLEGVNSYYAIHAGREFRVIVDPHKVNEAKMDEICREIERKVQEGVGGPGVEIVVCRETKVVDYAR